MVQKAQNKQSIIAAVIVSAVFGVFIFSAIEVPHDIVLSDNKPFSSGLFTSFDCPVDWLAEDAAAVNRANNPLLRECIPVEINITGGYLTFLSMRIIKACYFSNRKNTVQLSLRI